MIITKTPFRMSFFGGGTDMESFFKEHGGAVLSTTFDKYCYVNVRHLPRFFDYSTELSYSKTERVTNVDDIAYIVFGIVLMILIEGLTESLVGSVKIYILLQILISFTESEMLYEREVENGGAE